jgi:hypothetical protein
MLEQLSTGISSICPSCGVDLTSGGAALDESLDCPSCGIPLFAVPTAVAVWFFDASDLRPANPNPPFYPSAAVAVDAGPFESFTGVLGPYETRSSRAVVVIEIFGRASLVSVAYSEMHCCSE